MGDNFEDNLTVLYDSQQYVIRILLIISACFSLVGASSIVAVVIAKQKICHVTVQPLFQLSLVDILAAIFLIVTSVLANVELADSSNTCAVLYGLVTALYVTALLLTVAYALDAFTRTRTIVAYPSRLSFSGNFKRSTNCNPWYIPISYVLAWVIPLLIVFVLVVSDTIPPPPDTGHDDCALKNYGCLVIFHHLNDTCLKSPPKYDTQHQSTKAIVLILICFAAVSISSLYFMTYRSFRKSQLSRGLLGHRQNLEAFQVRNSGLLYFFVFLCCWLPAFILGLCTFGENTNIPGIFWLYCIVAVTLPLHGLVNSLVYGWFRKGFLRAVDMERIPSFSWRFGSNSSRRRSSSTPHTGSASRTPREYQTFSFSGQTEVVEYTEEPRPSWRDQTVTNNSASEQYA